MKICPNCQKEIIKGEKQKDSHYIVKKFCNSSCASSFNNRNRSKEKEEKEESKNSNCINCHIEISLSLLKDKKTYSTCLFCKKCRIEKRMQNRSNTTESKTKSELFSHRTTWQSARSAIRKHAEKVIKASDLIPQCKICNYSVHVEICHIKAVSDFSPETLIKEINDIYNLIYLCPNHHWEYDNGILDLE